MVSVSLNAHNQPFADYDRPDFGLLLIRLGRSIRPRRNKNQIDAIFNRIVSCHRMIYHPSTETPTTIKEEAA